MVSYVRDHTLWWRKSTYSSRKTISLCPKQVNYQNITTVYQIKSYTCHKKYVILFSLVVLIIWIHFRVNVSISYLFFLFSLIFLSNMCSGVKTALFVLLYHYRTTWILPVKANSGENFFQGQQKCRHFANNKGICILMSVICHGKIQCINRFKHIYQNHQWSLCETETKTIVSVKQLQLSMM